MPRDGSGNYTLPSGNPVVTNTLIESAWANATMSDVAVQFNNVLTRDGVLGPINPFKLVDGSVATPGLSFNAEPALGYYRIGTAVVGWSAVNATLKSLDGSSATTTAMGIYPRTSGTAKFAVSFAPYGTANRTDLEISQTNAGTAISSVGYGTGVPLPIVHTASQHTFNGPVVFNSPTTASPVGMFGLFMLPAAPSGWIAGDGSTIGNVGSGAGRANADTQALFTAWWAYSDAVLPIYTSAGVLSARGASAAADWAANKRLTVFDVRDRVPRSAGTIQANGVKLEATRLYYDNISDTTLRTAHAGTGVVNVDGVLGTDTVAVIFNAGTSAAPGANTTASVRGASIGMLGCFKL